MKSVIMMVERLFYPRHLKKLVEIEIDYEREMKTTVNKQQCKKINQRLTKLHFSFTYVWSKY